MLSKIKTNKKNIVILGAGFTGLRAAKQLASRLRFNKEYQIILVDRRNIHVYNGDLYEISTAYNEKMTQACQTKLQDAVTITMKRALKGLPVVHAQSTAKSIDPKNKTVTLSKYGEIPYEYLVMALGSVTNYYNIPGLAENSFPLKTVENALAINCHLDQMFRERYEKKDTHKVHIAVGGGGYTGAEFACELVGCIKKLGHKYHFNPEKDVEISIIQGSDEFVGLGKKVSDITIKRFKQLRIKPITNTRISGYNGKTLKTIDKKGVPHPDIHTDMLVWTGGIMVNPLLKSFPVLHESGGLETYSTLESPHYPKVYAGGDNATIFDPKRHNLVPKIAQLAIQQGRLIGENIYADIIGKKQKEYHPVFKGYIVPLGGTYFVYSRGMVTFAGIIPYMMRRYVDFHYFASWMPFGAAIKKWMHTENIFLQND
ncbi:FAD-dependent oxidoreductase [Candidatus Peregrinibacteria bacterium]|nr:FAD-dependent oxidoreductase [Candidatus Peregrinibacteria bacterium]